MIDQTLLELETRKEIDQKLISTGWVIQDKNRLNLRESLGVAVRDKFAGKRFWTAEGCQKGQGTGIQPYQLFDEGNAIVLMGRKHDALLGYMGN